MNRRDWVRLNYLFIINNFLTYKDKKEKEQLLEKTKENECCPDWWDNECYCKTCLRYLGY